MTDRGDRYTHFVSGELAGLQLCFSLSESEAEPNGRKMRDKMNTTASKESSSSRTLYLRAAKD